MVNLFRTIERDMKKLELKLKEFLRIPVPLLSETGLYLLEAGGKRMRPIFALLAGRLFCGEENALFTVAVAIEVVHMASLAHDDIVDDSALRRGRPTLAARWGSEAAVVTGDYLLAQAMQLIYGLKNRALAAMLARTSTEMCRGEICQIQAAHDTGQSIYDYFYKIRRKTALLLSMSCEAGAVVAGAAGDEARALRQYGQCLGMAFQMVDDILDIEATKEELGKPVGSDVRQGVITLPMIIAMSGDGAEAARLRELLARKEKSAAETEEALALIRRSDGIPRSREAARRFVARACQKLPLLPNRPERAALERLAVMGLTRRH
ncbi:MAG: polyprenyl synthetase family protein [Gracilibacteraceae bacterium]|jgi:heptaprenyl diphosphate synthase|nr:polyprenyl synthetase family protein [Gracilibacteraceae bacterium]